jgi:uncharacterized protein YkwD
MMPPGAEWVLIMPGQPPIVMAPGQPPVVMAPGQWPGVMAPGQQPGFQAPGQLPGFQAPGQLPGFLAPGQQPGQLPTAPSPAMPVPGQQPPAAAPSASQQALVQAVLDGVNRERSKAGLAPLALSPQLCAVATERSQDMASRNYFSHTDPDGHDPWWHYQQAGLAYKAAGENIAEGQPTPESVVSDWMNSPGHRANILNPAFRTIGIGVVQSAHGLVWTQDFAG